MTTENAGLLYGYAEIGEYLGLTDRQVEAMADVLPIFDIKRRKCALKSQLDQWLADKAAQSKVEGSGNARP